MTEVKLVVSRDALGCRAAVLADGQLVRLAIDDDESAPRPGDVLVGRVRKVSPALGAAFVDLGTGRDGLLMRADWGGITPVEGAAIGVRVLRAAVPGKGPKLAAEAGVAGGKPPLPSPPAVLRRGPSPVDGLLAAATAMTIGRATCDDASDAARLRRLLPPTVPPAVLPTPGTAFRRCGVDAEVEAALSPEVRLPGGGRISIAETPACVAIDVDSGGASEVAPARTALMVNREAAVAIGRAIAVRALAGAIIIDFLPMTRAAHRGQIADRLAAAVAADGRELRLAGFTRLGLFEMRLQRLGPTLAERLLAPCPACDGSGRHWTPREAARRAVAALVDRLRGEACGAPRLIAAPAVVAALKGEARALLTAAEDALGRPLAVEEDATLPADGYRIEGGPRQREMEER